MEDGKKTSSLGLILATTHILLILTVLALMLLSFAVGGYAVFNADSGNYVFDQRMGPFAFFFAGLPIVVNLNASLGDVFTFVWITYMVFFVIALRGPRRSIFGAYWRLGTERFLLFSGNTATAVVSAFSSLVILTYVIEFLQQQAGIQAGKLLEQNPILLFIQVSVAPLSEEIGFRVTLVGLVAVLLSLGRDGANFFKVLWSPARHLKEISTLERYRKDLTSLHVAVALSAVLFGASHVLYGGGWQIGKVTTSAVSGVVLGWLYVHYGLPGAVLLHWSFNFFAGAYFSFGEVTGLTRIAEVVNIPVIFVGMLTIGTIITKLGGNYFQWRSRRQV